MNRRISLLLILVTILLIASFSCKINPVIPPEEEPTNCFYPAGNRNYTWRVDTVAWFPSWLGGVWAFSDSDAYVMGEIFQRPKGVLTGYLGLHWNGKDWDTNINGTVEEIKHVANDVTGDDQYMVSVGNWSIDPPKPALGEFDHRTNKWKGYQFQIQGELRSVWTDGKGYFIAVGDNGMVYKKDGYTAEWIYQKAPTDYSLHSLAGISKDDIYMSATQNLVTGEHNTQGWKLYKNSWIKLYDTKDTSGMPLQLTTSDYPNEMGVWRCSITDSLKLYVIGDQSYLFESKGQQLEFRKTNLSDIGLPLKANGRTGVRVNVFTPNDIWIIGTRYNFYHWNGENFIKMLVPGLPADDMQFGWQLRLVKTKSGKMFFGTEVSSQVYVIYQMTFI
ncbi:MAG: hypothetical protein Q8N03_10445 [Ignavibacteria bacterium]|nr:hypothetical protein [Ignavibacteria bacterium]